jgi:hypothetical protein
MNEIRIPNSFKLLGQTITVEVADHLASHNGTLGEARAIQNSILLQRNVDGFPIPETQKEHILLHEIFHLILGAMGQEELAGEESFIDLLAGLTHQVLSTMEYEDKKPVRKTVRKPKK